MTRRTIASDNRVGGGGGRFPKLEFKNKGEYHRVLLFQKDELGQAYVWQEYVHVLRVPKFKEDGTPKMTLKDSKRNEDEKYEDYDTDWLGSPLCLGRAELPNPADPGNPLPGPLVTEGFDAENCPVCAAVPDAPAEARLLPQLTFAINVVEFALAPNSWQVQRPLSAKVVIWRLNTSTYDDIISQQDQHGELLQQQDLTLEVVNPGFRTVKMGVMAPSGWTESANGGAYLAELLNTPGNIATDDQLRAACGREAKRIFMQEDLATCLKKWRKAKQVLEGAEDPAGTSALGGGQQPTLAQGVSELLNGQQPDPADVAQQVAAMRDQTRAEVTGIVNPNPFSEFTPQNAQAAAEQQHAQVMSSQPPAANPFGALSGTTQEPAASAPAASTPAAPPSDPFASVSSGSASGSGTADPFASAASPGTPPATAPAAQVPASTPTAPQHSDPFAAAAQQSAAAVAPTTAPSPGSPAAGQGKAVSFDDMIASLDRNKQGS